MSHPIKESEAEAQGFEQYEQGAWEDDNPYMTGTQAHEAWFTGWYRAFLHYAREREMDEKDRDDIKRYR